MKKAFLLIAAQFLILNLYSQDFKLDEWQVHEFKAIDFTSEKDFRQAIKEYDIAISLNNGKTPYKYTIMLHIRGFCKYMLQEYSNAIIDFNLSNEAIAKYKVDNSVSPISSNYLYRGACKMELFDTNGGCDDFLTAKLMGNEKAAEFYNEVCSK